MALIDPEEIKDIYKSADQLPSALWDDLDALAPADAAHNSGATWNGEFFLVPLIGRDYKVDPAQRRVHLLDQPDKPVGFQTGMVLLTALGRSMDLPPSGRMVTPQELPGGAMFFVGPHALALPDICAAFGQEPKAFLQKALSLGAEKIEGADVAVKLPGLPKIPLYVLLWAQDDEFEARSVIGIDAHASFHLALDSIWALTNILVKRLTT